MGEPRKTGGERKNKRKGAKNVEGGGGGVGANKKGIGRRRGREEGKKRKRRKQRFDFWNGRLSFKCLSLSSSRKARLSSVFFQPKLLLIRDSTVSLFF